MTAQHVYVDESQQRGLVLAAVAIPAHQAAALRKAVRRDLVLPGQTRTHMAKESDPRRRIIADWICRNCPQSTVIYSVTSRHRDPFLDREACLNGIISNISPGVETLVTLDRDDSIAALDRRCLYTAVRNAELVDTVRYEHQKARSELLLSLPDAIAWCWTRGGHWRQRIQPAIRTVQNL